ncbi:hypothetical protein JCM11641_008204 [Rhodosporidiobolus odoratus]
MKRALSNAGSPPPNASKPKKARGGPKGTKGKSKQQQQQQQQQQGSPPPSNPNSPYPGASSPPAGAYSDSPAAYGAGERSLSAAAIDPALAGVGGGNAKGKERAGDGGEGLAAGQQQGEAAEDEEAEDEAFAFDDDEFGSNQREAARQKEDLRVLLEHFDDQQMDRYEAYRRSGLAKGNVRKLVNQVLGQSVSPSILTVVRGFAKVFVGEIVEKARSVADHPGALTPQDLREAHRLYLEEHDGAGAGGTQRKKLFVK